MHIISTIVLCVDAVVGVDVICQFLVCRCCHFLMHSVICFDCKDGNGHRCSRGC